LSFSIEETSPYSMRVEMICRSTKLPV